MEVKVTTPLATFPAEIFVQSSFLVAELPEKWALSTWTGWIWGVGFWVLPLVGFFREFITAEVFSFFPGDFLKWRGLLGGFCA